MSEEDLILRMAAPSEGTVADEWRGIAAPVADDSNALYLELDGWEGPLDLLLDLARRQKVDLKAISILALVDQYILYIERAEALKLEIAADYLVMAAWLAYLKSAMLLPKEEQEDPSPEELALRLQLRLQRLGAMREAGARLMARDGAQGLRIGVKKGGYAGMEYTMEFAAEIGPMDEVVEQDGARVMIAPMAQMFLFGTEIDYHSSLLESGFQFNNPNVAEACGCGESIKFKDSPAA